MLRHVVGLKAVRVQVIPANEELGVARQTYRRILSGTDMTVEQTL